MNAPARFHIGKQGISAGIIHTLLLVFKTHTVVRITILPATGRDREKMKEVALALSQQLQQQSPWIFTFTIIGFTLVMKRHLKHAKHLLKKK